MKTVQSWRLRPRSSPAPRRWTPSAAPRSRRSKAMWWHQAARARRRRPSLVSPSNAAAPAATARRRLVCVHQLVKHWHRTTWRRSRSTRVTTDRAATHLVAQRLHSSSAGASRAARRRLPKSSASLCCRRWRWVQAIQACIATSAKEASAWSLAMAFRSAATSRSARRPRQPRARARRPQRRCMKESEARSEALREASSAPATADTAFQEQKAHRQEAPSQCAQAMGRILRFLCL
mmetsp:Transcript_11642/g.41554  ORF Transcript_11642/g.41554 Transcript_11642/m.41554 type:complete len:235 (-) Transcript_11642:2291-2995(-)